MPIRSVPVKPDIPAESSYPVSKLNLFEEFTRASYKAASGIDSKTFDPAKPIKNWVDTSGTSSDYSAFVNRGGLVTYEKIDLKGMKPDEANFFGLHSYEPYVIQPTQATYGDGGMPVNPLYLSDAKAANELAWALGAKDQVIEAEPTGSPYPLIYPSNEKRRMFQIKFKGQNLNAGMLIAEQNYAGVGGEGNWETSGIEPNWISQIVTSIAPATPAIPVPQRPLDVTEKIFVSPFGFAIFKIGVGSPLEETGGGGFTIADRAMLVKIYEMGRGARG